MLRDENAEVYAQKRLRAELPLAPSRFLGRQPIVDERSQLFGYELLYRDGISDKFEGDPEQATSEVVDHWLMLLPEPSEGHSFVNCTRQSLLDGIATLLPPKQTVVEILETVEPDEQVIGACRSLREQGYRLALDDFVPKPTLAPLIEVADFIKIDFRLSDAAARREIYSLARRSRARLIAEKVETEEEMRIARSEGCSLFQGYFFSRPVLVASRSIPQNHLVYLRLLAVLQQIPADVRELERLVLADAALCYRVLRLANSALHGHAGVVTTVRGALMMVGDDAVRRIVAVALAGALAAHRSAALVTMAVTRARFCELLAPAVARPPQQLYLLGLLSLLDVLLSAPMPLVLSSLPLPQEMKAALVRQASPLAPALDLVRSFESCDWRACESLRASLGLTESSIAGAYVESLRWASSMVQSEIPRPPDRRRFQ